MALDFRYARRDLLHRRDSLVLARVSSSLRAVVSSGISDTDRREFVTLRACRERSRGTRQRGGSEDTVYRQFHLVACGAMVEPPSCLRVLPTSNSCVVLYRSIDKCHQNAAQQGKFDLRK